MRSLIQYPSSLYFAMSDLSMPMKALSTFHAVLVVGAGVTACCLPWEYSNWWLSGYHGNMERYLTKEYISIDGANGTTKQTFSFIRLLDEYCDQLSIYYCTLITKVLHASFATIALAVFSMVMALIGGTFCWLPRFPRGAHTFCEYMSSVISFVALIVYPIGTPRIDIATPEPLKFAAGFWIWYALSLFSFILIFMTTTGVKRIKI